LANTQGKKAKRKAREKMLDEAKRLADLHKRRELKQAGLLSSAARTKSLGGKRKRGEMDLGVEIPFHKPAPIGFHDTTDEDRRADMIRNKRLREVNVKQINESQYRTRDREEKDAQKREDSRIRALERSNMQYIVSEVSKVNDPVSVRKRGTLAMPEPSVADSELEKIARMAQEQGMQDLCIRDISYSYAID
jgi:pre-mRNA-splicing factor CDC5/CEF1